MSEEIPAPSFINGHWIDNRKHPLQGREKYVNDEAIEKEIKDKGLTAPRVTPERIQEVIASEHYFTAYEGCLAAEVLGFSNAAELRLLTFCVLVLKNGFTVTGESACASPENFDAALGRKVARQHAVAKIWPLEGYVLKEKLFQSSQAVKDVFL